MSTVQLCGGRGTYGPLVPDGPGVSPLWLFMRMPPAQNSLLVYRDGDVVETSHPLDSDVRDSDLFILGGTDFRCDTEDWEYPVLLASGYTFCPIPERDSYTESYSEVY
jgi:hypothetical protein